MLATLDTPDDMKIRDRIRHGVRVRLEVDADHREAARRAAGWMSLPDDRHLAGDWFMPRPTISGTGLETPPPIIITTLSG